MPSPFLTAGGIPDKPSRFAPLYVNRFFSGLYTNSNPLSEAAVPFLYQKFYSGARYETLRGGVNVEVSPRLTLIRRPGCSSYNTQAFPSPLTFYSLRVFNQIASQTQIRVIVDTATGVYDGTGPNTQKLLYTKKSGAGQTSFQTLGNTMYAGDGVSTWKYIWAPPWTPSTTYKAGNVVTDQNGYLQILLGVGEYITTTSVVTGTGLSVALLLGNTAFAPYGTAMSFTGLVTQTWLNGQTLVTSTNSVGTTFVFPPLNPLTGASQLNTPTYSTTGDQGWVYAPSVAGVSSSTPSLGFSSALGSLTVDPGSPSLLIWKNIGPAVRDWGIIAPTVAPTVSNVPNTNAGTAWAASTYYNPSLCIVDSNNNIQLLTTGGTTSTVPSWNGSVGGTTTDGTAVWTNQGTSVRATSTAYAVGAIIAVTYSYKVVVQNPQGGEIPIGRGRASGGPPQVIIVGPYFYFFQCTIAGTSSSAATNTINWQTTNVTDGTVTWTNIGPWITRTSSSTSAGSITAKGNIGNSQAVTLTTQIVDSNGNVENLSVAGLSGSSHPTWATSSGASTADNQATWINGGPATTANTGAWQYGYAYMESATGHISSMSPASSIITLTASSLINIYGNGDPHQATDGADKIVIYRTVQGASAAVSGGTYFQLTIIPAPVNGGPWSFQDATPDPPATGSILNELIQADVTGQNAPPPTGLTNLTYYLNRIFGSAGVFEYYSGVATQPVGVGAESWPALNYAQMPEQVNQSWPSATGLLILTVHGVYFSQGTDSNGNPNTPIRLLEDIGLLSPNLFTVNGSIPAIFTADSQLITLDPSSGVSRVSDPIADILAAYSNTNSYLTWHVNGIDSAYYIADGSIGWYRLCPTAAPESGLTWSPQAKIAIGARCVKSIETSPGVKQLLIGSPFNATGIIARDLTTSSDIGVSYPASVVVGSIVFAQSNQCAEIASITTTCKAVGSSPTVSVMGDEITGTFEALSQPVTDPPFLNPPSSLFSQRWYFSTLQQPAWMKHMQLQISWPTESAANELLDYSIFGAIHTE